MERDGCPRAELTSKRSSTLRPSAKPTHLRFTLSVAGEKMMNASATTEARNVLYEE
jgi:hypothetical protein